MSRAIRLLVLAVVAPALGGCPRSSSTSAEDAGAAPSSTAEKLVDAGEPSGPTTVSSGPDGGAGELMNSAGLGPDELRRALNPTNLPVYSGPTGAVEGKVWVEGPPSPDVAIDAPRCPGAVALYGKRFREGPPRGADAGAGRALVDTVVAVTGYKGFYVPEKREAASVLIDGCGYTQRTVTMTFGQRLEVRNTSTEFWSPVLEPAPNAVFMMAPPRASEPVRLYPKRPGLFRLGDHDRKYVNADLYAFLHPLHTVTSSAGHYRIDGVPVGKVKVNARHPAIEDETTQEIEIRANVVAQVDLVIHYTPKDAGAPDVDSGVFRPVLR
jgi:hypothetical protein